MVKSPAAIPFIPLLAAGVSAGAGIYAGNKASKQNAQIQQGMAQTQAQQMGLFNQAQQLFPAMAGLAGQYGQAAGGFLQDRAALAQMQGDYAPLMDQMARLYGQNPTGPSLGILGNLAAQDVTSGPLAQMRELYGQDVTSGPLAQMRELYGRNVLGGQQGALTQLQGLYANGGASDGGAGAALRQNASQVMGATDPSAYRAQARQAGADVMGQLSGQLAGRGILSSGTTARLGASTLARLYTDAAARGNQDRLNAFGISNSALGQAGQMSLAQGAQRASLLGQMGSLALQGEGQRAGLLGQMLQGGLAGQQQLAGIAGQMLQGGLAGQQQLAGIAGQMGQLGLAGQGAQAGLLGQIGNLLGQRQQGVLAGSGLLGQYLQGLQGQSGMLGNIAGLYNQQAGALGGMWQQQASQVNPNPYAGLAAGLGALGPAAGQFMDWRAKGMMTPQVMPGFGAPAPGFGVTYSR